jgi:hypothetical protein
VDDVLYMLVVWWMACVGVVIAWGLWLSIDDDLLLWHPQWDTRSAAPRRRRTDRPFPGAANDRLFSQSADADVNHLQPVIRPPSHTPEFRTVARWRSS